MDKTGGNGGAVRKGARGGGRIGELVIRRRYWSREEEECLIIIVKRLINEGWKSGNGWRGGFFRQVELYIKEKLPHSDIRGEPHVNSKLTVWKRDYVLLFEFMKLSGVSKDPTTHMIIVDEPDIWDNYVKTVPDAKNLRGKSFPYYEHWCEIFGKDRATGEHAADCTTFVKSGGKDESGDGQGSRGVGDKGKGVTNEEIPSPDIELQLNEDQDDSEFDASPEGSGCGNRKRKRIQPIVNLMSNYMKEAQKSMDALTKAIETIKDANHDTVAVFETLGKIPNLSMDNHILVAQKLVNNPQELALFCSMPDNAKSRFVAMLIEKMGLA